MLTRHHGLFQGTPQFLEISLHKFVKNYQMALCLIFFRRPSIYHAIWLWSLTTGSLASCSAHWHPYEPRIVATGHFRMSCQVHSRNPKIRLPRQDSDLLPNLCFSDQKAAISMTTHFHENRPQGPPTPWFPFP